ncbi:MAG TPA: alcohol dehydrogenase catalytic domain-containing protein [Mycobacteriales bacterium]|nr:alcohol dehydrogenase catalytic domain-containing protein [Mycobacteriales bacterium]
MKAAVIRPGGTEVTDVGAPIVGPDDVLLRPVLSGICGTDLHVAAGDYPLAEYPLVPGHEVVGVVIEIGARVSDVRPGDHVAVQPNIPCRSCRPCRRGRHNLCERYEALGITRGGGMAALQVAPAECVYPLPEDLPWEQAVLAEPLSCAVHAFDALPRFAGEHYLVYGAGTMGVLMALLAKRAGAGSVSIVEVRENRRQLAEKLGIGAAATSADAFGRRDGWDVVVECSGAAPAIADGLARIGLGGTYLQVGVAGPDVRAEISPHDVFARELRIAGTMAVHDGFGRAVDLIAEGLLDTTPMVTHRLPLADYADGLALLRDGEGLKIAVEITPS